MDFIRLGRDNYLISAETELKDLLDLHELYYLHVDGEIGGLAKAFRGKAKRPDFLCFVKNSMMAIDAKGGQDDSDLWVKCDDVLKLDKLHRMTGFPVCLAFLYRGKWFFIGVQRFLRTHPGGALIDFKEATKTAYCIESAKCMTLDGTTLLSLMEKIYSDEVAAL